MSVIMHSFYGAGLAEGFWSDLDGLRDRWRESRCWVPCMSVSEREGLYAGWRKAVRRTLNWVEPSG